LPIRRPLVRALTVAVLAALPVGCIVLPPPIVTNPFVGTWTTRDNDRITFRDDTIVVAPARGSATVMANESCNGAFGFGYETKGRDALTALVPRQSDLRGKLAALLVQPDYPVAEMRCDQGYNTYVLLGGDQMVAVYRDGAVAGIDRLTKIASGAGV